MKFKLYRLINENKSFAKFIYALIVFNIFCLIIESYSPIRKNNFYFFQVVECISVFIFTIEYIIRLWVSNLKRNAISGRIDRWNYALSGYGLIDLFAILPFYLPLIFPFDLRVMRILRLFRLLRIFKLGRYSKSIKTISDILKESKPELFVTVFIALILLTLSSTLIFYAENGAQPNKFSSIVDAFWWSLGTLTTVGYEDAYPITPLGKFLSAMIAVIGIGFVALPTGIISSALIEKVRKTQSQETCVKCPNCGK